MKRKKSLTCIAVIKHRGKVYVAADRRSSWDFSQAQEMPRAKVRKRNGLILAATGDGGLCSLIVDNLNFRSPEEYKNNEDEYFNQIFYNDVIKLLKSKGFIDVDQGLHPILKIPHGLNSETLMVLNGRLYSMQIYNPAKNSEHPNGLVVIDELNFPFATGCGGALAWGSLLTTENMKMNPKDRLIIALEVAAQVSPGCDNKVDIEHE